MSGAARIFLHLGAPKTGTTFLQGALSNNRKRLFEQGVGYPGDDEAHHRAAWDLREVPPKRTGDQRIPGAWDDLVRAAEQKGGHTVASSELFAYARPRHIQRARRTLRHTELHLVLTVRDLARQVPAVWQERVKNQHHVDYASFVDGLLRPEQDLAICRAFWFAQDAADVLQRWADDLPPEHVHVVTVPPSGAPADELWRRFCTAVDIAPDGHDLDVPRANVSLTFAEAELLRRVSANIGELSWGRYRRQVRDRLLPVLAGAAAAGPRAGLPEHARAVFAQRSQQIAARLEQQRYDVVGSLEDLVPPVADEMPTATEPGDADVLGAAIAVIGGLIDDDRAPRRHQEPG